MTYLDPASFFNGPQFHAQLRAVICGACGWTGGEIGGLAKYPDLLTIICGNEDCNDLIEIVAALDPALAPAVEQGCYIKGTEGQLKKHIHAALSADFEIHSEVWLRDPLTEFDLRIDFLTIPTGELAARFPFDCLGVEVKPEPLSIAHQTHALKQCVDYRHTFINDRRLPRLNCTPLECVALYQGRMVKHRGEATRYDAGSLMRFAGLNNVGELVHEDGHDLSLLISHERIWSKRYGITDSKTKWPRSRRVGNSLRRDDLAG